MSSSTQQEKKQGNPNPSPETRFGGVRANPQSPGGWDKNGSISYQYNRLIRMSEQEFNDFENQPDDKKTMAMIIAYNRLKAAKQQDGGLMDTKEITDRTEGKAPQSMDITSGGEKMTIALVEFIGDEVKEDTE